jgi:hypothetical protein
MSVVIGIVVVFTVAGIVDVVVLTVDVVMFTVVVGIVVVLIVMFEGEPGSLNDSLTGCLSRDVETE